MPRILPCCVLMLLLIPALFAQRHVDPRNMYERVYAIVPMIGSGTYADPKRPMFAPAPSEIKPGDRSGIIGWHFEPTDDGKLAILEIVYAKREVMTAAQAALSAVPLVRAFAKGKDSKDVIEGACQALKKDFSLDRFAMKVSQ
jgi:hypothetical protein